MMDDVSTNEGDDMTSIDEDQIGYTDLSYATISTVALPSAYRPMHYETLVRGGILDGKTERYERLRDALAYHARWELRAREEGPMTNSARASKLAERMRDHVTLDEVRTIVRDLAANPDTTVADIADAVERPWDYAELLVADEDAHAGTL